MMEKLAQACGWGHKPTIFHYIVTITYKVAVYAPAEWADTLILFHLDQYMYSVSFPLDFTPPSTFAQKWFETGLECKHCIRKTSSLRTLKIMPRNLNEIVRS
jgi:hypothetical protein